MGNMRLLESFGPEDSGVAYATGKTFEGRIMVAVSQREIHIGYSPGSYDFEFAHMQQRSMDPVAGGSFDSRFCHLV
jgi:hypothetical protein